jgi:hypothetical protein
MDEETGKITGMLAEYISYAKDCLGNQTLEFNIHAYDDCHEEETGQRGGELSEKDQAEFRISDDTDQRCVGYQPH